MDWNKRRNKSCSPLGSGLESGGPSNLSLPPRLLVSLTGGAGGLSSSLDILLPCFNFVNYFVCVRHPLDFSLSVVSPSGWFIFNVNPIYLQRFILLLFATNCTTFTALFFSLFSLFDEWFFSFLFFSSVEIFLCWMRYSRLPGMIF